MNLATHLARAIARERQRRGWSQNRLAVESEIGLSTINKIEREHQQDLLVRTVERLCSLFEVGFDYLLLCPERQRTFCIDQVRISSANGRCSSCGLLVMDEHSFPECVLALHSLGKSPAYIAQHFGLTLKQVRILIEEEVRITSA